jgi:hypothetical protein
MATLYENQFYRVERSGAEAPVIITHLRSALEKSLMGDDAADFLERFETVSPNLPIEDLVTIICADYF